MAQAVRFDQYGGIDVLYVAEVDIPSPPAGEVVVAVRAAGVNPGEAVIRQGYMHDAWPATFPSGQGSDLAGVIHSVGDGVTAFSAGHEVLGWTDRRGSHAQFVVVPADQLIDKPAAVSWEEAGALFVAGTTAYAAVRAVSAAAGDTVVVSGAAGGVGSIVVQLLRAKNVTTIGIASDSNHEWLSCLGVTPVAYGDGLIDRVRAAAPAGVDAFIDLFGPDYVTLALDLGVAKDRIDTIISFAAAQQHGIKAEGSAAAASTDVLQELAGLVAAGTLRIPIAAMFSLDQVRQAYTQVERRHSHGKVVLLP